MSFMLAALILGFFLQTTALDIGEKSLVVEIADTPKAQTRGLMGRKELPEGQGMLFVYNKPVFVCFDMQETLIPLSIGFFNKEKVLLEMRDMDPPSSDSSEIPSLWSSFPIQYALEVPQGWFQKNGISPGAKFAFRKGPSRVN